MELVYGERRPRLMRTSIALPVLLLSLGVLTTSCTAGDPDRSGSASASNAPRTTSTSPSATPGDALLPQPGLDDEIAVGARYRYRLFTHCGVEFVGLDGDVWQAEVPLGDGNVPRGWRWSQPGVIEVVSSNTAVFSDSAGHEVTFLRRPNHRPVGCA